MIGEPTLEFLAIHLRKGGRQQFVANWSLKTILSILGSMANDATHGSGLRLNHLRVRKLANQWLTEGTFPAYPPLIIAIEKGSQFKTLNEPIDAGFGILSLPLSAIVDVCDGIHRIAALRHLQLSSKILTESEWPVELIECQDSKDAASLIERFRGERHLSPGVVCAKTQKNHEL